jgi:hypothetical protein
LVSNEWILKQDFGDRMFFLPDINQLGLGKTLESGNLFSCRWILPPVPPYKYCENIEWKLTLQGFLCPENGAISPNVLVAGASPIESGNCV